jgi:hypothetical protein
VDHPAAETDLHRPNVSPPRDARCIHPCSCRYRQRRVNAQRTQRIISLAPDAFSSFPSLSSFFLPKTMPPPPLAAPRLASALRLPHPHRSRTTLHLNFPEDAASPRLHSRHRQTLAARRSGLRRGRHSQASCGFSCLPRPFLDHWLLRAAPVAPRALPPSSSRSTHPRFQPLPRHKYRLFLPRFGRLVALSGGTEATN